jgi:hypothetical protein
MEDDARSEMIRNAFFTWLEKQTVKQGKPMPQLDGRIDPEYDGLDLLEYIEIWKAGEGRIYYQTLEQLAAEHGSVPALQ